MSAKYRELIDRFETARKGYVALVKGAEASHMMLEQYVDIADLSELRNTLDTIIKEAKDRLDNYDEYLDVTDKATALLKTVKLTMYSSQHVSSK